MKNTKQNDVLFFYLKQILYLQNNVYIHKINV